MIETSKRTSKLVFLTVVFVTVVLMGTFSFCDEELAFNDIENHWAKDLIQKKYSEGLVEGYPDGSFRPDEVLTKAQLIAIVNRSFGLSKVEDNHFIDVDSNDWYKTEVDKAEYYKYISGVALRGEEAATPRDAVMMIASLLDIEVDEESGLVEGIDNLSSEEMKMYKMFEEMGYLNTEDNRNLDPDKKLNRAEILNITDKVLGYVIKNQNDADNIPENVKVTIIGNDVKINNASIDKLYISPGMLSDLTISNSVINNGIEFYSDSEDNSLILDQVKTNELKTGSRSKNLQIELKGKTRIDNIKIENSGKLKSNKDVIVLDMELNGKQEIYDCRIRHKFVLHGGEVNLYNTNLNDFFVEGKSDITIDENTLIKDMDINGETSINGEGTIRSANINSEGVNIDIRPENISVESGLEVVVLGKEVKGNKYDIREYSYTEKKKDRDRDDDRNNKIDNNININPISVTISGEQNIEIGKSINLKATIEPSNTSNKGLLWESSDDSIATVIDGVVNGLKEGNVEISVRTVVGGFEDKCEINVYEGATDINKFRYTLNEEDMTIVINGFDHEVSSDNPRNIVFSETYQIGENVYQLLEISVSAFDKSNFANKIESVVFPDSIKKIGPYAFTENAIVNLELPENLEFIGGEAFSNNNIEKVIIPEKVESIQFMAFQNNKIDEITFSSSVKTIEDKAFYNNNLESIELPENLTNIGISSFAKNHILNIDIPEKTLGIELDAFAENTDSEGEESIKSVTINGEENRFDSNWERIGFPITLRVDLLYKYDFNPKDPTMAAILGFSEGVINKPSELIFPSTIMNGDTEANIVGIFDGGFSEYEIKKVVIPETFMMLDGGMFNPDFITSVEILGDDPTRFNEDWNDIAFPAELLPKEGISGTAIGNFKYKSNGDGGAYVTGLSDEGIEAELNILVIPDYVELEGVNSEVYKIAEGAFASEKYETPLVFTEVVIPETISSIRRGAFFASKLTSVTIPEGVVLIEDESFGNNNDLTNVVIEGVAHRFNDKWETIGFPESEMPNIEIGDFTYSSNGDGGAYIEGFSKDGIEKNSRVITIPSSVEIDGVTLKVVSISEGAFDLDNYDIDLWYEEIVIPDSVVIIRQNAFRGSHLKNISIPATINYILDGAFSDTLDIESLEILGVESRFNENWEAIGFPIELKPADLIDD